MRDIKKEILKPNKIVLWVVGVIATFITTFIFTIITFLGLLSQWFLLAIPVFCLMIFVVISMITNGYIILNEDSLELKNGSEDSQFVNVSDIIGVHRQIKDVSSYVAGERKTATERTLVFELKDGQTAKINDTIYSAKNRKKLYEYLEEKGIEVDLENNVKKV